MGAVGRYIRRLDGEPRGRIVKVANVASVKGGDSSPGSLTSLMESLTMNGPG